MNLAISNQSGVQVIIFMLLHTTAKAFFESLIAVDGVSRIPHRAQALSVQWMAVQMMTPNQCL